MIVGTGLIEATYITLGQPHETLCPSFQDRFTDRTRTSPPPHQDGDVACNNHGGEMMITKDLGVATLPDVS